MTQDQREPDDGSAGQSDRGLSLASATSTRPGTITTCLTATYVTTGSVAIALLAAVLLGVWLVCDSRAPEGPKQ